MNPTRGVNQADVYQMMAYARLYRCERLMLLYPAAPHAIEVPAIKFGVDGGAELLAVGRIDLAQEINATVAALRQMTKDLLGTDKPVMELCA